MTRTRAVGAMWSGNRGRSLGARARRDFSLLGLQGLWVLLTAVHFHFAGFGCLLIAGLLGRLLWSHRTGR